jgi:thioesterase domain-containing protein
VKYISTNRPIYGLQDPAFTQPGLYPQTLLELAQYYVDRIRAIQPAGPYHILGYSFGGLLAYTIATLLQSTERIALLILWDLYPPKRQKSLQQNVQSTLPSRDPIQDTDPSWQVFASKLRQDLAETIEPQYIETVIEIEKRDRSCTFGFVLPHCATDILFFAARADKDFVGVTPPEEWTFYVRGTVTTHQIDCVHTDMCTPAALAQIGPILNAALETLNDRDNPFSYN